MTNTPGRESKNKMHAAAQLKNMPTPSPSPTKQQIHVVCVASCSLFGARGSWITQKVNQGE
jgi:hypothetical protein